MGWLWASYGEAMGRLCELFMYCFRLLAGYGLAMERPWGGYGKLFMYCFRLLAGYGLAMGCLWKLWKLWEAIYVLF